METRQANRTLTRVGPGTPMGTLLRRYWWPVAADAELVDKPTKAVTLLGEKLVLFRDRQGGLGLISARCAHRSFDMGVYAIPEDDGLRCPYHGWVYAADGRCLETPPEPRSSTFKDRIRIPGYPVQALGGLIWAYLGPEPAPLLPRWDLFVMEDVIRTVGQVVIPCNWLQCMENSVDTVHTEWLHGWMFEEVLRRNGAAPPPRILAFKRHHERIDFDRHKYGIVKRRLLDGQTEDVEDWTIGHPLIFPGMVRLGGGRNFRYDFQIRVPIDDEHTWHLLYQCYDPGPGVEVPKQDTICVYETPLKDQKGDYRFDYILAQDMVSWWSQGPVVDRSVEKLADSDKGLILFRRLLREQMKIVEQGGDPINVFRDPAENDYIRLAPEIEYPVDKRMVVATSWIRDGDSGNLSPILDLVEEVFARAGRTHAAAAGGS